MYPSDFAREHLIEMGIRAEDVTSLRLPMVECGAQNRPLVVEHLRKSGMEERTSDRRSGDHPSVTLDDHKGFPQSRYRSFNLVCASGSRADAVSMVANSLEGTENRAGDYEFNFGSVVSEL